ncbi:peroxiredoxin [Desulfuromonas acetoxidans]|uniref:Thioredoxin-like n=1 Tax=Desulfuromonas acetoxidans (strain DSM 684 / 11070) TaxID=281689 RepID=Q1JX52_DESA6|nr:TlpA disulfide reductase family protein [Desulfuromonas acetoxidans]EAT14810.1 Thioredoxin-like [Desulfuromonas acetoxidans DSM 684]MBF0645304.1 TlpA family protein disulfide reductase [Desulfuromonas acetoxidans]NVD25825.1 TlpA family protein disulfide reductase [Desulfuromonas acetoxidans]NVE17803.1 TlpA family protein disulfide reductase [Desulfuromonas acetoxidans]
MQKIQTGVSSIALCFLLGLGMISSVYAQAPAQAVQTTVSEWVQGKEAATKALNNPQLTVVEFFSTWCSGCTAFAPHLSRINNQFSDQGVTVIALSDEDKDTLTAFTSQFEGGLSYAIGIDQNNTLYKTFMEPLGENTIPYSFILNNQGEIIWHGHPADGLEVTLQAVIDNNYDAKAFQQEMSNEQDLKKSAGLFEAYAAVAKFADEQELARQLAVKVIDCSKSKPESLALLTMIFLHDFNDYPMAALAMETAVSRPLTENETLEAIYINLMEELEIPSATNKQFLTILAEYRKQGDQRLLTNALKTFAQHL